MGNVVNRVFDSSGPEGKVRGTPQQIIEKYTALARDAQLSGDRVNAENFAQHAEHYQRLLAEAQREAAERQKQQEAQRTQQAAQRTEKAEATSEDQPEVEETASALAVEDVSQDGDNLVIDTPETQADTSAEETVASS